MSELWKLIQAHLDEFGVREAALARRMGTAPQTLNSWKKRGMRQLPTRELIEALAREIRQPYAVVLRAILVDLQYAPDETLDELSKVSIRTRAKEGGRLVIDLTDDRGEELDPVRTALVVEYMRRNPEFFAAAAVAGAGQATGRRELSVDQIRQAMEARPELRDAVLALMAEGLLQSRTDDDDHGTATTDAGVTPAPDLRYDDVNVVVELPHAARTPATATQQSKAARDRQDRDAEGPQAP